MASSIFQCPQTSKLTPSNYFLRATSLPLQPTFLSVARIHPKIGKTVVCATFAGAGSSGSNSDINPYEVLGVNPLEGFDMVKAAYAKKRRDAEKRGDDVAATQLEKAYDKIMMSQLTKRKKGETFGSFRVSKDIKYADKQPIVPWGPRFAKSEVKDIRINMSISAVFEVITLDKLKQKFHEMYLSVAYEETAWIFIKRAAEYKPLQFLAFAFVYRIFEKLKAFEPPASPTFSEDGEDEGRMLRMGKRLLRALGLVFGCVAFASLGYTGVLNVIEFAGGYIPVFLYSNQELLVTASTALMLYVLASYYR